MAHPVRCFAIVLLLGAAAFAQPKTPPAEPPKDTGPLPGHSSHGQAFNEGPRQKAYLMRGMPKVHFAATTKKPEAQQFIEQGVGQLHGFWYFESERSFRQAAAIDPDCAMAYWGMAVSNIHNVKRAKAFIEQATKRKAGVTQREQMYIDAYAAYFAGAQGKDQRQALIKALETIIQDFPDDLEAKAFLAFHIWESRSQVGMSSAQAVDALIQQVLTVEPTHPVHHYRIHLWDYEKAKIALTSASKCGQSAPGIAHMWHMSGHIYDKVQRYSDAAWQQEASARVDHAHMMRDRVLPDQIHNFAHNNEWLVRTLSAVGRAHDAEMLARNMIELPRHPKYNVAGKDGSAQFGAKRLADVLERFELWDDLIECTGNDYLAPVDEADRVRNLRLRGVACSIKGDAAKSGECVSELEKMLADKKAEQDKAGEEAEKKARDGKKDEKAIAKAKEDARKKLNDAISRLDNAMAELTGYKLLAENNPAEAIKSFEKAKDMSKNRLALAYVAAGIADKAEQIARGEVGSRSKQTLPLAVLAEVLWRAGKKKEAIEVFEKQLLPLASQVDLAAPPFARLAPIAQELKLSADWRPAYVTPADVGDRPNLDSLGPFRWQPQPAAPFKLADADGKPHSLSDYHGKPVLVIFFLGHGCLHCTQQLGAFAPMTKDFADAGITIVGVSTDSVADLHKAVAASKVDGDFPFLLLSNHELDAFKAYRAFDDFENAALHGAFLIDGKGLVRWQDISYEPFMDVKFLLAESKRLLALPAGK